MTDIKIVGLNTDKTRRIAGRQYHVYFELSKKPEIAWANIFDEKFKEKCFVSEKFILLSCMVEEISTWLSTLKSAIIDVNKLFDEYIAEKEKELRLINEANENERKIVEDIANSLNFD